MVVAAKISSTEKPKEADGWYLHSDKCIGAVKYSCFVLSLFLKKWSQCFAQNIVMSVPLIKGWADGGFGLPFSDSAPSVAAAGDLCILSPKFYPALHIPCAKTTSLVMEMQQS